VDLGCGVELGRLEFANKCNGITKGITPFFNELADFLVFLATWTWLFDVGHEYEGNVVRTSLDYARDDTRGSDRLPR
jgi:hypothetical protein